MITLPSGKRSTFFALTADRQRPAFPGDIRQCFLLNIRVQRSAATASILYQQLLLLYQIIAMTLRELEGDTFLSVTSELDKDEAMCPFTQWYEEIKDTDIEDLDNYDLHQLLTQNMFREFVMPLAMERVIESPINQGGTDADLLEELSRVSAKEWAFLPTMADLLRDNISHIQTVVDAVGNPEWSNLASILKSNLDTATQLL
jgi:hypothetical protein